MNAAMEGSSQAIRQSVRGNNLRIEPMRAGSGGRRRFRFEGERPTLTADAEYPYVKPSVKP
jgi:hypothetical protein